MGYYADLEIDSFIASCGEDDQPSKAPKKESYTSINSDSGIKKWLYNHSEKIKIPKDCQAYKGYQVIIRAYGATIGFSKYGKIVNAISKDFKIFCSWVLSNEEFKRK